MTHTLTDEIRALMIELLAHVYARIDWRSIRTGKNAWDVWNHRVRSAATRPTIGEAISRLANHFGLQHIPPEAVEIVMALEPHQVIILDHIYREHIPVAMRAVMRAKEMKDARAARKQTQEAMDIT